MSCKQYVTALTRRLAENCQFIADSLRNASTRLVSDEEIAAYWPGGSENNSKDQDELERWIVAYGALISFWRRTTDHKARLAQGSEEEILKALADEPQKVILQSGETLTVYPKSFVALQQIERWDARIDWLTRRRAVLVGRDDAEDLELLERTDEEIAVQYGLIVACATHVGARMPEFDDLPARARKLIETLTPIDLTLVRNATIKVNALRFQMLKHHLTSSGSAEGSAVARQNWQTFFAIREDDSHTPASTLMNDRSLTSQLAAAVLVADIRQAQIEEAKRSQSRG